MTTELVVHDEPGAARRAREFAAATLITAPVDLVDNVRIVVTELVANALLYGAAPVTLRLHPRDGGVRVEVIDHGRTLPVTALRSTDAMTGRGLELVAALTSSWGVAALDEGKSVWAELEDVLDESLSERPIVTAEEILAAWHTESPEERYVVRLDGVPVSLLIAAKVHIDNVVRELTLVRAEEASSGVALPAPMAALVTAVTEDFAEARGEIKRQALAAVERGDRIASLVLNLPLSAAAAAERYLDALDRADQHARAARLLTLAPPTSHRAFRHWYIHSLVAQLRGAAGEAPPSTPTEFSQLLADEVDRLAYLEESWDRLQLLQALTKDLAGAQTVQEIAHIAVAHAGSYNGAESARVYALTDHRTLASLAWHNGRSVTDGFDEIPLDSDLPGASVARTGQPLFMRSLDQIYTQFPELEGYYPAERSLHVVPLMIRGHSIGLLALTFLGDEVADDAQVAFVGAIADVLAQAMERALAHEAVESERGRDVTLLTAQMDVLADIMGGKPLGNALASLLVAVESVSTDGMLGSVLLLDEDGQHLVHCAAPSLPAAYNAAIDGITVGPRAGSCGTAVFTGKQVIVADVMTDPLWADFRDLAAQANLGACWSTPIIGRNGTILGTFALYYPQSQRPSPADLALIDVLVRTVTMTIERSRADEAREAELVAERTAALTLQHSLLPAVPAQLGQVQLEARYRTGDPGVEVGGDWFDAVAVETGTMLVVGDVQGHDLQAAALMGQLRTVARAAALEGHGPVGIITGLHRYLSQLDTDLLTTAVVVHLDDSARSVTVASAGHLPPLVIALDPDKGWSATDLALTVGPPLGLHEDWVEVTSAIPPGATLLLYTDGLVETRTWSLDHGLMLLRKSMRSLPPTVGLDTVLEVALELVPAGLRGDDVAVLAARTPPN